MKILITGCAGFIGSHLSLKMIKNGFQIIGLDNLNNYYDVGLKYGRLAELGIGKDLIIDDKLVSSEKYPNMKFIKTDLMNIHEISRLFENENFSLVIHLAAQAGVRYSIENPREYLKSNVDGFFNVLECIQKYSNEKKLIYASSSSVYGNSEAVPFKITDSTDHPVSFYAATKKTDELFAAAFSEMYNLQTAGVRLFTVYGPWGRPDMAYYKFTEAILEGSAIEVYNKGQMLRDFTYIDDIVDGFSALIKRFSEVILPGVKCNEIYNLGNSNPVTLLEFIEILEEILGKKAKLNFKEFQIGDVKNTHADITASYKNLNYSPKTNLKLGLKHFINWYLNH